MIPKKQLEKEIEIAKQVKFRNCLVCEKQYSLRQSTTKRYCSRKCSAIAERVRDWENKRGMNLRILKATLTQTNEIIKLTKKCRIPVDKISHKIINNEVLENRIKDGLENTFYYVISEEEFLTKIKGVSNGQNIL